MERVVVGMSGGVDSSVAALLLKRRGYDTVGVFMNNWDEKDENGVCTSDNDWRDVQAVCGVIGMPCYSMSFAREYRQRVFAYFLDEYKKGRTPNPDVLCNREIKFKAFLEYGMKLGAEYIATGHFVKTETIDGRARLLRGDDPKKDQSYFLYMLKENQLARSLFPVGGMTKKEVRDIARENGLPVSGKRDSTGICFIGERNFRSFLKIYLPIEEGDMVTPSGEVVGRHMGLAYYTIGQRRGLGIGGAGDGRRWFALEKDMANNRLIVVQGDDDPRLYTKYARASLLTWISREPPFDENAPFRCTAKYRYRQADQPVTALWRGNELFLEADEKQRAVTPGQSVVLYDGPYCLGGAALDAAGDEMFI